MIGSNDANAINPKPSTIGLRPLIEDANPIPSAVTSGTVIVDVVTIVPKQVIVRDFLIRLDVSRNHLSRYDLLEELSACVIE